MTSKEYIAKCTSLSDEGRGIIKVDNLTLFVDNLLIDEEAKVKTYFKNGKLFSTKLVERITTSSNRVTPKCKYYDTCGGCQIMHLSYNEQLSFKQNKVKNLLHKFGNIDLKDLPEIISIQTPYSFRNKVSKPCFYTKDNKPSLGFYKENSHDFTPIDKCLLEEESLTIISKEVNRIIKELKIEPYNEKNHQGLLRHVVIKSSSYYKENLVCFVLNSNIIGDKIKKLTNTLVSRVKSIKSVVINFNTEKTNVILSKKEKVLYGSGVIKDRIFNNDFVISSQSFYQTNSYMNEILYKTAFDMLNVAKTDEILDAYSGTGTIGITISQRCKKVTLCELNKEAYQDSLTNIENNNIKNVDSINEDCTKFINNTDKKFDIVILDPPRKGTTKEFIEAIFKLKPKQILYISCNPATLARDLNLFKEHYELKNIKLVDMFPHSEHVETVILLSQRKEMM